MADWGLLTGQEEKNLKGMMAFDHGLSATGVQQALELRQRWLECHRVLEARAVTEAVAATVTDTVTHPAADPASEHKSSAVHHPSHDEALFCGADRVFSSPLTRAAETAVLALSGHPTAAEAITMLRSAREIRRIGGLDTVGDATGPGIEARTLREMSSVLGETQAEQFLASLLCWYCWCCC